MLVSKLDIAKITIIVSAGFIHFLLGPGPWFLSRELGASLRRARTETRAGGMPATNAAPSKRRASIRNQRKTEYFFDGEGGSDTRHSDNNDPYKQTT